MTLGIAAEVGLTLLPDANVAAQKISVRSAGARERSVLDPERARKREPRPLRFLELGADGEVKVDCLREATSVEPSPTASEQAHHGLHRNESLANLGPRIRSHRSARKLPSLSPIDRPSDSPVWSRIIFDAWEVWR